MDQNKNLSEDNINTALISGVMFLMVAAILTQFQQEDAFIYFRTAQNLAIHGEYSYNLGENYPGATSFFYAFLLAANYYIFDDFSLISIQVMNCCVAMIAAILLAKFSYGITNGNNFAKQLTFWIVGTSSPLIVTGTAGLETAFLIFSLAYMLFGAFYDKKIALFLAAFLIPLLRIETIIAPIFLIALGFASSNRNWVKYSMAGLIIGTFLFFSGNYYLTGNFLPQTITAKNISYQPSKELVDIAKRFFDIWFGQNYLLGIPSKIMTSIVPPLVGIIFGLICIITAFSSLNKYDKKTKIQKKSSLLLLLVVLLVLSLVFGYCVGGISFSWYFWPSGVLLYYLLAHNLAFFVGNAKLLKFAIALLSILSVLNLISLTNYGYKFNSYFAEIGRFIAKISGPDDTLLLEPAGYIPYYASIHTWDTVGLVNSEVLKYRQRKGSTWWIQFVKEYQPTWIIERQPIHKLGYEEGGKNVFSYQDQIYFNEMYYLRYHFVYEKTRLARQELFSVLYNLGHTKDFYLYRRRM